MHSYSGPSIYDMLQLPEFRQDKKPEAPAPKSTAFNTDFLIVEDAWLLCGSGDLATIMAADTPPHVCDFVHDRRIRDKHGNYLGISRVETGGDAALRARVRACQLLEWSFDALLISSQDSQWQESRVILQVPPEIADDEWLDDVLMLWPVDKQPTHGIELTSLPFDEWMAEELARESGKTECLQFISVQPLCVPQAAAGTTPGEAVACMWLKRAPVDGVAPMDSTETANPVLKLMLPSRASHEPRQKTPRGSTHLLEAAIDTLKVDAEAVQAVVWDGHRHGFRLDPLIGVLQQRFAHLFLDTDLWSVQGIGGSVPHASAAVQVVLATQLARQRQGDILLLDSHDEERTLAMRLHHEDVSQPSNHG